MTFSLLNLDLIKSIDLKAVPAARYYSSTLSVEFLKYYNNRVLDGEATSVFFIDSNGEIVTPEFLHPVLTPYNINSYVMRDAVMVYCMQKLMNAKELCIDINKIPSFKEAFITSDTCGIILVDSIDFNGRITEFSNAKAAEIQNSLNKVIVKVIRLKTESGLYVMINTLKNIGLSTYKINILAMISII
jgi:branched-subunit amino acid aminotransferase/4-amino-4-deoxychorismate lyase